MSSDIDTYINSFDNEMKAHLTKLRGIIREVAPKAHEQMSYGMPAYKLNGKPLVYFGGFAHHVGFYATPNGHDAFKEEFAKYKQGKGSVQFPNDQPLPVDLIRRVVAYRRDTLLKKEE
jgi:uncharacterized protein YdhG (YjbR/CyaY superfamily)